MWRLPQPGSQQEPSVIDDDDGDDCLYDDGDKDYDFNDEVFDDNNVDNDDSSYPEFKFSLLSSFPSRKARLGFGAAAAAAAAMATS